MDQSLSFFQRWIVMSNLCYGHHFIYFHFHVTSSVKTPSHSLVSLAPTNEGGDLSNPRMDLYEVEKSFW